MHGHMNVKKVTETCTFFLFSLISVHWTITNITQQNTLPVSVRIILVLSLDAIIISYIYIDPFLCHHQAKPHTRDA